MMNSGERQVAPTVEGIRRDHVARYEWAARRVAGTVLDLACGVGYGSWILAQFGGCQVRAVDRDREAIEYARGHYAHERVTHECADVQSVYQLERCDAAVCFETVEHIQDPLPLLKMLAAAAPRLLVSVPNEDVMPYRGPGHENGYAFHFRHYTPGEFEDLLRQAGWRVVEWWGQAGAESEVERDMMGRTIIAVCERARERQPVTPPSRGKHVAILGLGPSVRQYLEIVKRWGGRRAYCDETWGINALGDVFACDRIFHMDDVRIQAIRAEAKPDSNIARMLEWLKTTRTPVITSRAHPEFPALEEFPLREVVERFPLAYFNSTAAYAIAYALHVGAKKISCFGMDFTYPDVHDAEKGRACVEFWLGIAAEMGVEVALPKTTSLMDALYPQAERFYGYDTLELAFDRDASGRLTLERTERTKLPTAEEIEAAYSHQAYPQQQREAVEAVN